MNRSKNRLIGFMETQYMYKSIIIPVKCNSLDYSLLLKCNRMSAEVWNYCVKIDKEYREHTGKFMDIKTMQTEVKGLTGLHAKGVYHVYRKYMFARTAMFKSKSKNHKTSQDVKFPYKEKKYFNTGWDYQSIKVDYEKGLIKLSRKSPDKGHHEQPIKCHAKTIPQNIVEIELLYRNGLKLAIKYKEPDINEVIQSDNTASIDLGEIHSITSIDTLGNAIIITGRKLRDIKRLRDKEQAQIKSKMSKCTKGSRQYKKYSKALHEIGYATDRRVNDVIHKISKLYLDYCLENLISKVYYGDVDGATRNTKGRVKTMTGQKLNEWNYGLLMRQIQNKLERYKIELVKVHEYYTSKKCPDCGIINDPYNRNYKCNCGYVQHRDIVGAINILNDNHGTHLTQYTNKKYLRIA